jgi:hypothetical protein
MSKIVLELHGARARKGVDIDALESFIENFRAALREYFRAGHGDIAKRGGHPSARDAAAAAFRLVEFRTGSGIATLEPTLPGDGDVDGLALDDTGETLAVTTLRGLLDAIDSGERLPDPVVEALGSARRAIGDDGSFGVELGGEADNRPPAKVVIDEDLVKRLQRPADDTQDATIRVTGRMHMIEVDPPNRRVGIRAQDGIDWTCSYPDEMHALVTTLIERLVVIEGTGRRVTPATGRLRIEPIPEHAQDALFTVERVGVEQLRAEQAIDHPQGLDALVDDEWEDDEASRLFLDATLGSADRG